VNWTSPDATETMTICVSRLMHERAYMANDKIHMRRIYFFCWPFKNYTFTVQPKHQSVSSMLQPGFLKDDLQGT